MYTYNNQDGSIIANSMSQQCISQAGYIWESVCQAAISVIARLLGIMKAPLSPAATYYRDRDRVSEVP